MDSEDLDESCDDDDSNDDELKSLSLDDDSSVHEQDDDDDDDELKSLSLDTDDFVVLIHLKSLIGMGADDSAGGVGSR
jgi:hypothetical protein|uniref:Uncharacterized protein n=1 Tax=viral metagenome TaxID=1070528 RepID=A0A6C0I2Y1_9ZZZZ